MDFSKELEDDNKDLLKDHRKNLRTKIKNHRSSLEQDFCQTASLAFFENFKTWFEKWFKSHQESSNPIHRSLRIGVYSAVKNELDLSATIDYLSKFVLEINSKEIGVEIYMPAVHPVLSGNLQFRLCELTDDLACKIFKGGDINCYNILEPRLEPDKTIAPWLLDIVLMPLVACDKNGERLGMGGGYYDRAFSFKNMRKNMSDIRADDAFCLQSNGPVLIGCGYDFQFLGEDYELESREWDMKLDGFISPGDVRLWDLS